MNIYIDCEFNGFNGELISMALVSDNGDEFYEVLEHSEMDITPWVRQNVLPVLVKPAIGKEYFTRKLQDYLSQFDTVHVVADWPEDISYFCKALITGPGIRINTPPLTLEVVRIDGPSKVPHNALEDARGLKLEHWYVNL